MDDEDLKKPITWQMLKDFVNGIPEKYLEKTAVILFEDESTARELLEPFTMQDDIFMYDNDDEICGTLAEVKNFYENLEIDEPFDENLAKVVTEKGTPFLRVE